MKALSKSSQKLICIVVALIIGILSISTVGFWIDEAIRMKTSYFGSFSDAVSVGFSGKTFLMYIFQYAWTWIFGESEIISRALNIPFFLLAIFYFSKILEKSNKSVFYSILLAINPFSIYYLNDAGPYIMMLGFSTAFVYYIFFTDDFNSFKNVILINLFFLLCVGTHFILGFSFVAYAVKVFILLIKDRHTYIHKIKSHLITFACYSPVYLLLFIKYVSGIENGNSAFNWGHPGIKNLLYSIYGLLGYQGCFLSRNDLRAYNFSNITPLMIILTAILTLGFLLFILINFKSLINILKRNWIMCISFLSYFVVFASISYIWYFQFWERHVSFLLIFIMFIMIELIDSSIKKSDEKSYCVIISRILVCIIILCWAISGFNLRFNGYYQKDNYKGAASYATELYNSDSGREKIVIATGYVAAFEFYSLDIVDYASLHSLPSDDLIANEDKIPALCFPELNENEIKDYTDFYNSQGYDVILILSEKSVSSDYYKNADEKLNSKCLTERYNTFKIYQINC